MRVERTGSDFLEEIEHVLGVLGVFVDLVLFLCIYHWRRHGLGFRRTPRWFLQQVVEVQFFLEFLQFFGHFAEEFL